MAAGSRTNPIIIDCDEVRDGACARECHNRSAILHTILRKRRQKTYCLVELFDYNKFGIEDLRQSPRAVLQRQRSASSTTKVRHRENSAKPTPYTRVSCNRISNLARQKLERRMPFPEKLSEKPCCSCDEADGCRQSYQNRAMCYDCDDTNCRIGSLCTNRLATESQSRCKVLRAGDKGFGLFTNEAIDRERFVAQYTGEVIAMSECWRRYCSMYSNRQVHYVMHMDMGLACDAISIGSEARFLNHHCDPNCVVQKRVVSGVPCLFIFAKRHVKAGEELTLDYNFETFPGAEKQRCFCGAKHCRGFIG